MKFVACVSLVMASVVAVTLNAETSWSVPKSLSNSFKSTPDFLKKTPTLDELFDFMPTSSSYKKKKGGRIRGGNPFEEEDEDCEQG